MSIRHYSNTAPQLTLNSACSSSDTTIAVTTNFTGYPTVPFFATIDPDTDSQEVVLVTAATGASATITRGQDGTLAVGHLSGAIVQHAVVAQDFTEANAHVNATTGVHGLPSGDSPVGVTATQTLTNKTLTSPTINGGTSSPASLSVSGTATLPTVAAGTVSMTGDITQGGGGHVVIPRYRAFIKCGTANQAIHLDNTATGSAFYASNSTLTPTGAAADTIGLFQSGSPNTMTVPSGMGGEYRISALLPWSPNSPGTGGGSIYMTLVRNGSPIVTIQTNSFGPTTTVLPPYVVTGVSAGDVFELHATVQQVSSAIIYNAVTNAQAYVLFERMD